LVWLNVGLADITITATTEASPITGMRRRNTVTP